MIRKILAVFAHPDDEAFGPGGTLAKYAHTGTEVHLLCATRGESGQWSEESKKKHNTKIFHGTSFQVHHVREQELKNSAKILGISDLQFLDFIDGELCNNIYHKLADKIIKKIREFKPQVIVTLERLGVSGHLDHIAVSMITTFAYLKTTEASKLYYECMTRDYRIKEKRLDDYFIYFPEGYDKDQITTTIDWSQYWNQKKEAMQQHQSQLKDVNNILKSLENRPKVDYFILYNHHRINTILPETDLFAGIDG